MKTNLEKLVYMLEMQNSFQVKTFGEYWWQDNQPQHRAIWIEAGELAEWYGYKWWKQQDRDIPNAQVELVDIWHFAMNMFLVGCHDFADQNSENKVEYMLNFRTAIEGTAEQIWYVWHEGYAESSFFDYLETLVVDACSLQKINVTCFRALCDGLNMTFDDLFEMYIAKNVLNQFRQNHGYKTGTYRKMWPYELDASGRLHGSSVTTIEDNEVVMYLLRKEHLHEIPKLMARLEKMYAH